MKKQYLKHYKFSVNNLDHKCRCYSSNEEITKYLNTKKKKNTNKSNIKRAQKKVQEILQIMKVSFPIKAINPSIKDNTPYKQILLPPSIVKEIMNYLSTETIQETKNKLGSLSKKEESEVGVIKDEVGGD